MRRVWIILAVPLLACAPRTGPAPDRDAKEVEAVESEVRTATFGGGCFWCVEAVYQRLEGVTEVVSGYAGGETENPTYGEVCSGDTGHAEVCRITYDPGKVTYVQLLEVFFKTHDPTTPNRQGADVGTQYRSIILTDDEEQRRVAEEILAALDESGAFPNPIVTEIAPLTRFYPAEPDHQDYFDRNASRDPYCRLVIVPKLEKLEKTFSDRLKKGE